MEMVASVIASVINLFIFFLYLKSIKKISKKIQKMASDDWEAIAKLQQVQTALEFTIWNKDKKIYAMHTKKS